MNFFEKFNKLKNKSTFKSNFPKILALGSFALLLVIGGTSYAYLTDTQSGTLINTVSSGTLTLSLDNESEGITLSKAVPQLDEDALANNDEYTFTVTNTGDLTAHYEVILNDICSTSSTYTVDGTSVTPDLCIDSSYVKAGIKVNNGDWIITNFENNKLIIDAGQISSGKSKNYIIKLWLDINTPSDFSGIDSSGNDRNALFVGSLSISGEQTIIMHNYLYKLIASESLGTDAENNIDYGATPTTGVYTLNDTASDENPVHFYRGEVTNNNIVFGKYCWKIVRTTSTGGVKLIYNGEYTENNKCNNTGTASQLSEVGSRFNIGYNSAFYVGYYYDTSNTMETMNNGTALNTTPSTIATAINTWYASEDSGMTDLTYMLENEKWCNDRTNDGTNFGAETRIYSSSSSVNPSIECPNNNDAFTLSVDAGGTKDYGNNVLPYPVGLLTADEATLAGSGYYGYSSSAYLISGQSWWLGSSRYFSGGDARGFAVFSSGVLGNASLSIDYGVRPAVSLIPGAEIEEGNTGTADNPYIVVLK